MARAIPTSLSGVLEHLELEGETIVTLASLRAAMGAAGFSDAADDRVRSVAYLLRRAGWLGTVSTRNAWEFLPGARAGAYSAGDRFLEFRAYAATHPGWIGTLAMESAASVHGLAQRFPEHEVLVLPKGTNPPKAFAKDWRVITSALPATTSTVINDLRTWTIEALLVGIAERPTNYRDAAGLAQWLPEAVVRADVDTVISLLASLSTAARQRTAYLFSAGGGDIASERILGTARPSQVAWFGPRGKGGTFDPVTGVNDTLLRPYLSAGIGA